MRSLGISALQGGQVQEHACWQFVASVGMFCPDYRRHGHYCFNGNSIPRFGMYQPRLIFAPGINLRCRSCAQLAASASSGGV